MEKNNDTNNSSPLFMGTPSPVGTCFVSSDVKENFTVNLADFYPKKGVIPHEEMPQQMRELYEFMETEEYKKIMEELMKQ